MSAQIYPADLDQLLAQEVQTVSIDRQASKNTVKFLVQEMPLVQALRTTTEVEGDTTVISTFRKAMREALEQAEKEPAQLQEIFAKYKGQYEIYRALAKKAGEVADEFFVKLNTLTLPKKLVERCSVLDSEEALIFIKEQYGKRGEELRTLGNTLSDRLDTNGWTVYSPSAIVRIFEKKLAEASAK